VGDRDNEIDEAREYVRKAGYQILAGSIPEKTAYRRASDVGKAMTEISFLSLRQRAEEVAQSVIDRLSKKG